jgi:ankyrin repeat protein
MHWIFAFNEGSQNDVVSELIGHGADLNAKTSHEVPFLHYPFRLPSGTPLHWAVATFSHSAVKILVEHGADVLIRDGSDPYIYDDRVRILNKFEGLNQEAYSFSETGTEGLSSLELAAMHHDPFRFEALISLSKEFKINDTDEEGFTVLHRLSNKRANRTRMEKQFLTLPFRGCRIIRESELGRTIEVIKALGGHLEQLTTSIGSISQNAQRGWDFPSYSPLMLAVLISSTEVIKALLNAVTTATRRVTPRSTVYHKIQTSASKASSF